MSGKKAVLISVQPTHCARIGNRKKPVEIRKNKPNIPTPFKCYIYCTQRKPGQSYLLHTADNTFYFDSEYKPRDNLYGLYHEANGTVIGEFMCDTITPLFNVCYDPWDRLLGDTHEYHKKLVGMACLSEEELREYANGKNCYAWHISDLVIYDKPKALSEFYTWKKCNSCRTSGYESSACIYDEDCKVPAIITRPPQSWCYVEELR